MAWAKTGRRLDIHKRTTQKVVLPPLGLQINKLCPEQKRLALLPIENALVTLCHSPISTCKNSSPSSPGIGEPDAPPGMKSILTEDC